VVRQHQVVRVGCLLGTFTIGTAIADRVQAHKRDNDTTNGSRVGNPAIEHSTDPLDRGTKKEGHFLKMTPLQTVMITLFT
jgi:hypothetical protein